MKILLLLLCFSYCITVAKAQNTDEKYSAAALKKDIDFVKDELEKNTFITYRYINKTNLDHKFDSLKQSIKTPLTANAFNLKLSSILALIGDGHLASYISISKIEPYKLANDKLSAIYLFDYHIADNKLYIVKNFMADLTIIPGTEVLSINGIPARSIIDEIDKHIPADGYNITFKHYLLNKYGIARNYNTVFGFQDSLSFKLATKNGVRTVIAKASRQADLINTNYSDILPVPAETTRMLRPDSSVAYLKAGSFVDGRSITATYPAFFKNIKKAKTQTLVLDLRGNEGGAATVAISLLSYLIDTPTFFYTRLTEVLKRFTVFSKKTDISKKQLAFYMAQPQAALIKPNEDGFKGKLYVLIDGGTFSTAGMVAAHIQSLKKAIFIGAETGGNSTQTTAGDFIDVVLPTSKVVLHYPIHAITLPNKGRVFGHGVLPDVPITYTINDYLDKKDLEMEWVLKNVN